MSEFASTLMDMGFPKDKVERALEVTGNQGVEPAMEWLLAHGDELNASSSGSAGRSLNESSEVPTEAGSSASNETAETAKSIKCEECGKLFKSQLEVEFHATKSGHSQFSESTEEKKPLSEEEKRQQMALLEQRLKEKKREREEKEKEEALAREKNRIRSGKEVVAAKKKLKDEKLRKREKEADKQARQKIIAQIEADKQARRAKAAGGTGQGEGDFYWLEDEELKKAIELRKREKEADKQARQKIIAQIEADKQARRAKAAGGTGQGEGAPSPPAPQAPAPAPIVAPPKDYTQTRLQIRLPDGSIITQSFGVKEQLSAVRLYIEMNRTDNPEGPFSMMTTFPRKVFGEEDFEKPLDVLGLVPSAVLIVTKAPA